MFHLGFAIVYLIGASTVLQRGVNEDHGGYMLLGLSAVILGTFFLLSSLSMLGLLPAI